MKILFYIETHYIVSMPIIFLFSNNTQRIEYISIKFNYIYRKYYSNFSLYYHPWILFCSLGNYVSCHPFYFLSSPSSFSHCSNKELFFHAVYDFFIHLRMFPIFMMKSLSMYLVFPLLFISILNFPNVYTKFISLVVLPNSLIIFAIFLQKYAKPIALVIFCPLTILSIEKSQGCTFFPALPSFFNHLFDWIIYFDCPFINPWFPWKNTFFQFLNLISFKLNKICFYFFINLHFFLSFYPISILFSDAPFF